MELCTICGSGKDRGGAWHTHTFLLVQLHDSNICTCVDVLWETHLAASPSKFLSKFHFHILSGMLPHLHTSPLHICACVKAHTSTSQYTHLNSHFSSHLVKSPLHSREHHQVRATLVVQTADSILCLVKWTGLNVALYLWG